ncbi:cytochrome-c peroxidase [Flavobacterium sp. Sd200]|uniref:cytochrome-c peroxidase n=1 Tax=Flavobacterium sp. Sd200 TaxID=2692211 RepID=UPI00136EA83A|nr:cytochrome c peroxidase [Flavobacterium sp. Sd200]MXN91514.1 cytochrome-c peroxidase [Flavobacterium sp. Sd200]
MNFKFVLPVVAFVVLCFAPKMQTAKSEYYQDEFKPVIVSGIKAFNTEANKLNATAAAFAKGETTLKQLRQQLAQTRKVYKLSETWLEYYYPKHSKAYLNGAPLKHLDPYPVKEEYSNNNYYGVTPQEYSKDIPLDYLDTEHYRGEQRVIDPVGLQALDEMIFSDEAEASKDAILELTKKLTLAIPAVEASVNQRNFFYDFEIIEAARLELVRIFTMGVTGFDTPGSLNALPEAVSSIKGIEVIIAPLIQKAPAATNQKVNLLFKNAKAYLTTNNSFDNFDRLEFLTAHINPLYKELGKVQQSLKLPSSAQRWTKVPSWNAESDNIFSEDFLNPYYYSLLKKENDSDSLRQLGKKLFYDASLSKRGNMSCASCHKPELAFTDGQKTSLASVDGKRVLRNSPTLINSVFADKYFYDLRAVDLEDQAEHVIANHLEFNTSFKSIEDKLNNNAQYSKQFGLLFKTKNVSRHQFAAALSSYVLSLRSFNSAFDRFVQGKTKTISAQIRQGFNLFTGKAACATCHYTPTFSGLVPPLYQENESEVLGVFTNSNNTTKDNDPGRMLSGLAEDKEEIYRSSFKTVTVRNAKLTAPYFHNGGYATLEEVLDFYNRGGAAGMGFEYEVPNQTLAPDALNLSKKEIDAIIAFIESLTDNPY